MGKKIIIAVDAMGGDNAPEKVVNGINLHSKTSKDVFYKIFGMNFFDSIVHSMTTIATGGFSNYNESIGYFDSSLIELTSIIFIILGSIPFIAYIKYLNGDKKVFYKDAQINFFIKTIIIYIVGIIINKCII